MPKQKQPQVRRLFTKVAGVTMRNQDGAERQHILTTCRSGEDLVLVREPKNKHDKYAVQVLRTSGEQVGYLGSSIVGNDQGIGWCIGRRMDKGIRVQGRVKNLTGESPRGINIELAFWDGPVEGQPETSYFEHGVEQGETDQFCGMCGTKRAEGAKFCGQCGFKFDLAFQ